MFTIGIVRSLQSFRAKKLAKELFKKHEIINEETDPEDLEIYRRHLGRQFVDQMLKGLDKLPELEKLAPLELEQQPPTPSSNQGTGLEKLSANPVDQWNQVSQVLDQGDLIALKKIWSGETISR